MLDMNVFKTHLKNAPKVKLNEGIGDLLKKKTTSEFDDISKIIGGQGARSSFSETLGLLPPENMNIPK